MSPTLRGRRPSARKSSARSAAILSFERPIEGLESRTLLSGGPLTVVITELGTSPPEQVTIVDNLTGDTSPAVGTINYNTPTSSPFDDFSISNLQITSNRTASPVPSRASLGMSGAIFRTTTTGGDHTLQIQVGDVGYLFPATDSSLLSSASATVTNGVAGDIAQFQSFYNTAASPVVTLTYDPTGSSPESLSGNASPTGLSGTAPFNLSNNFAITLAPSPSSGNTETDFQSSGTTLVTGNNASIAGNVYLDNNLNGSLDSLDTAIPSVVLTLSGTDAEGNAVTKTTTTAANGGYSFTGLTTGVYAITETQPTGYAQGQNTPGIPNDGIVTGDTISQVAITGGQALVNYNFGETLPVSIGDFVWNDQNADGLQAPGEPGIGGVTLTLAGNTAYGVPVIDTATTSANGAYLFNEIPGTYTVTVDASNFSGAGALAAYTPTPTLQGSDTKVDSNPNPSGTKPSSLGNSGSDLTIDFGYYVPVSINGTDYLVSNTTTAGSLTTSTTGVPIAGTTVTLTGTTGAGATVNQTTTTDSDAHYSFTGLNPSNSSGYTVTEAPPASDSHLGQASSTGGAVTTPSATPVVSGIVLTNADSPSIDDFFEAATVSLSGVDYLVSNATNAAGLTPSTTGIPIPGTTVTLTGTDAFGNLVTATATTNASGQYSFAGLNPSNGSGYTVTETPPASDTHVGQTSTTSGAVTTPAATPVVSNIVLTTNGASSTDNFFETQTVSITGTDYLVSNTTPAGSLTPSTTGIPIPGTTVTLTGTDEFGNPVTETTTTNSSGQYSFTGLNPSNSAGYTVTETPPASDTHVGQTSTTSGAVTTPASTPVVSNIVLTTNGASSTDNFFETATVTINGTDYLVSNTTPAGSLTPSTTGVPIAGTTVTLSGTDAFGTTVTTTTTTNASGQYSFTGLNPSNSSGYTVTETPPASDTHLGQTSTTTGAVTTPATTPVVSNIVLTSDGSASVDDYFETATVSISGVDFLDSNGDLAQQGDEPGIAGTVLTLSGTDAFGNAVTGTTTTDANGSYSFTGLNPSDGSGYTVTEAVPSGDSHEGQTSTTAGAVATPAANPVVSTIVLTTGGAASTDNYFETATVSLNGTDYLVPNATDAGGLTTSTAGKPIAGTPLTLSGTDVFGRPVTETTTTDAGGFYSFAGLSPSDAAGYTVTETPPSADTHLGQASSTGGAATTPPSTPVVSNVVLSTNGAASVDDFFETAAVSINGVDLLVPNATGAAGLTTSTAGVAIAGTTVTLSGTDAFGNAVTGTATTNAAGQYSFTGLNPSNAAGYTVTETPPAADSHLGQASSTGGAITTPASTPVVSKIVLTSNGASSTDNYFEIATVSISGTDLLVPNATGAAGLTTSTAGVAIAGTTVTLSGTDAFGNAVTGSTTTDAAGQYSFTGLNPSNSAGYTVTEAPPASDAHLGQASSTGGAITTPAATPVVSKIVLASNGGSSVDDFFEAATVSISGTDLLVPNATNAAGLTTSTAGVAIAGTTVTLTGKDAFGSPVSATATTNAAGQYSFTGLNPSNAAGYTVTETPPATDSHLGQASSTGGAVTTPASTPVVSSIVLTSNGASSTDNYFEIATVSINGTDYLVPGNTTLTTATTGTSIAGTVVTLSGKDAFGTAITATSTTNASGQYSFAGLNPSGAAGYTVTEAPQAKYDHLGQTSTTAGAVTATSPIVSAIVLTTKGSSSIDNFFEFSTLISGTVYVDATGVGLTGSTNQPAGSGDTGEAAVTVKLYNTSNVVVATTTTASDGTYSFTGVPLGTYVIVETVPANSFQTGPNSLTYTVTISAPTPTSTNDNFSNFMSCCSSTGLSGISYTITTPAGVTTTVSDLRGNTAQGDTVTANFTIAAGSSPRMFSLVAYEAPTSSFSASNAYQQVITDVATGTFGPGAHSLTVVEPDSFFQVDFVCGAPLPQLLANGSDIDYTNEGRLISADNGGTQTFVLSSLSGTVYLDVNGNDTFGSGDSGLANITLTLTGTTGTGTAVTATTTSNSGGGYTFTGLAPGIYTVTETQPSGYTAETANAGSVGGTAAIGSVSTIGLNSNTAGINYNFGELVAGSPVAKNQAATIGFWHNTNGQALINSLNGCSTATNLGNWLATTFPNLYGSTTGANNMAGKTNAQVASYFLTLFGQSGQKTAAQILSSALAVYSTNTTLAGGTMATGYNFVVSSSGTGIATINVGTEYAAYGGPTGNVSVSKLLAFVNTESKNGVIGSANANLPNLFNTDFSNINQGGDISQLAAGSTSTAGAGVGEIIGSTQLHTGTMTVAVDLPKGQETAAEQAAIDRAIASLNSQVARLGVTLKEVSGAAAESASIHITVASTTGIGGVSQGVLGAYSADGDITLVQGWDWYFGKDSAKLGAAQFDFQSVVTHELGHALGLGENSDSSSALDLYLNPGQAHRNLTALDLNAIRQELRDAQPTLPTSHAFAPATRRQVPRPSSVRNSRPLSQPISRPSSTQSPTPTTPQGGLIGLPVATGDTDPILLTPPAVSKKKGPSQNPVVDQAINTLYGLGGPSIDLR